MSPGAVVLLAGAGFLAGAVNAVAGGGSLISFPALLGAGYAAVPANVTNTVALWPGYVGGVLPYSELLRSRRAELVPLVGTSLLGAGGGAVLLLTTSASVFASLVPYLILGSCVLLAVQPKVAAAVRRFSGNAEGPRRLPLHLTVLVASVYGAYFGAGLGVLLLAVLGILLRDGLAELNGIKNALSLLINTLALVAFALFGPVRWIAVLIMSVSSLGGGYAGAVIARRVPARVLRASVLAFGVVVAGVLIVKG